MNLEPFTFPEFDLPYWKIRNFKLTDLELVSIASKDPLIPLITSVPSSFSETEGIAYIKRQWSRYEKGTGCSFVIAQSVNDKAIGSVYLGFRNIEDGRASLGYWIIEAFRGKGAAKIALSTVTDWAQNTLKIPRLELYVEPWNIASIKTAESVGYQQEGIMRSWQKVGNERKDMLMMSKIGLI